MEYLIAAQDVLVAAAADLEGIGSALAAANRAAEAPTTGLLAAGADEVSAAIASLFSGNAQAYQALSAQAAAFHQQFVRALSSAAGSYAAAEAANASPMQAVLDVVNGPTQLLLGRPLIGDAMAPTAGRDKTGATVACCTATAATAARVAPQASPAVAAARPG